MSASEKELIRVEDLHKSFGSLQVLKGVTEHVNHGEVVSVIGPSGGGKSTFLRCLNLLETPTSGKIYFEGTDITDKNVDINLHRQKMGMVFQHFNVFNNLTVGKNVTLAPVLLGKKTQKEADEMMRELLNRVGLADKENQFPKKLSGGQKQRLAIVRALAMEPDVMLFDEPTSALESLVSIFCCSEMQFIYRKIFSFRLPGYSLSREHFTHMNLLCSCFCPAHYIVKSP